MNTPRLALFRPVPSSSCTGRQFASGCAFVAALFLSVPAAVQAQVLSGNFLRVGVHASGALIDSSFKAGIEYDESGAGRWAGVDFLKPGSPYEFYALGYDGGHATAGFLHGNRLAAHTAVTSAGTMLSAETTGAYGLLRFSQQLSFGRDSSAIDFAVTLTNTGLQALSEVVYARGFDPDQDVYAGGKYETINRIHGGDLVTATAPVTGWTIGLFSDSEIEHVPSIRPDWPMTNPYRLRQSRGRNQSNADDALAMLWRIGDLAAGESATITFQYRIGESLADVTAIPEPRDAVLGAALAVLGFVLWRSRLDRRSSPAPA